LRAVALGTALAALAGCGEFAGWVAPGEEGDLPAQLTVAASVHASTSASDVVSIDVVTEYLKGSGARAPLGRHLLPLGGTGSQAVRVPVDLATCLSDADRAVEVPRERACSVVFTVALIVNAAKVDQQVIGPLRLTPGKVMQAPAAVSLFEIASIDLELANGAPIAATDSLRLVLGGGAGISARIRDVRGVEVRDRAVAWTSDAPAVVSVSSLGQVTAVALGVGRLTATIGELSRTLPVRVFRPPALLSIAESQGSGRGTVRSTPAGIDCRVEGLEQRGTCSATFAGDLAVTLVMTPDAGSVATGWGEACATAGAATECRLQMDAPRVARVRFTALRQVHIRAAGDGRGRVTGDFGLDCLVEGTRQTGRCDAEVLDGTAVALRATASDGALDGGPQLFAGWEGDCAGAEGDRCDLGRVTGDRHVMVRFLGARALRVSIVGGGSGRVVAVDGVVCEAASGVQQGICTRSAAHGTTLELTAVAAPRSMFVGWGGACAGVTVERCSVSLVESRNVTATFAPLRRVTVEADSGDGRGRVTGPGGLDCRVTAAASTGTCTVDLLDGTDVQLSATPDASAGTPQFFGGWGGACAAEQGTTCRVTASGSDRRVAVRFIDQPRIRVEIAGSGGGQVVAAVGIQCARAAGTTTGICERGGDPGTTVTLVATPDAHSVLSGWSGACASTSGLVCVTTLTGARTVRAIFVIKRVTLTLQLAGPRPGVVEVTGGVTRVCALPTGQASLRCDVEVDAGTSLSLKPVAGPGARFVGFGDGCTGTAPCTLNLAANRTVYANFDAAQVNLTVHLSGTGGGTIAGNGTTLCTIAAGDGTRSCTLPVNSGQLLQLEAIPEAGSVAGVFGGACTGASPCSFTPTADAQVTMQFSAQPMAWISVSMAGGGEGTVWLDGSELCSQVGGIVGGVCRRQVLLGATVHLSVQPRTGSRFEGWSGVCLGQSGTACTFVASRDESLAIVLGRAR